MKYVINLVPPVGTIVMSLSFLYFNPYRSMSPSHSTALFVWGLLIMPAILAIVAVVLRNVKLKYAAFILSLPVGLYLRIAMIPSYWNIIILLIALYPLLQIRRS